MSNAAAQDEQHKQHEQHEQHEQHDGQVNRYSWMESFKIIQILSAFFGCTYSSWTTQEGPQEGDVTGIFALRFVDLRLSIPDKSLFLMNLSGAAEVRRSAMIFAAFLRKIGSLKPNSMVDDG